MSKKTNLIYIIVLALALIGLAILFYLTRSAKIETFSGADIGNATRNPEITRLLNDNNSALDTARNGTFKAVKEIEADDHVLGKIDAPVQIILYSDFDCDFCADADEAIKNVLAEFDGQVTVAFRHFPIRQHAFSYQAAVASECANEQGKFFEAKDDFFSAAKAGSLNDEYINGLPDRLGINKNDFMACLNGDDVRTKIDTDIAEGKQFGVLGTPALFINREPIAGAVPFEDFVDSSGLEREGLKTIVGRHLK